MTYWIFGIAGMIGCIIAIWQIIVYLRSRKNPLLTDQDIKRIVEEISRNQNGTFYLGGLDNAEKELKRPFDQGLKLMQDGKYNEAIETFKSVLSKASGEKLVGLFNSIGLCYLYLNDDYDTALKNFIKSAELAEEINDKKGQAVAFDNIALSYSLKTDFQQVIEYCQKALKINEELNNTEEIMTEHLYIGFVYSLQGNYDTAENYLKGILDIQKKAGNKKNVSRLFGELACVYLKKKDYESAIKYFSEQLAINKDIGEQGAIIGALDFIARAYDSWGKLDEALKHYNQALKLCQNFTYEKEASFVLLSEEQQPKFMIKKFSNKDMEAGILFRIGKIYVKKSQKDIALKYFDQALEISKGIEDKELIDLIEKELKAI